MRANQYRGLTAVFLPIFVLVATALYWHLSEPLQNDGVEEVPIAFVRATEGLHHAKRANSKKIWDSVQEGFYLFPGDSVKTGDSGEVTLEFLGRSTNLEVEAESKITLGSEKGKVLFKLDEGFAVAKFKAGAKPLFFINNDVPIEIQQTSLFSRSANNQLQVVMNTQLNVTNPYNIQWLEPLQDFEHETNPEDPQAKRFAWQGKLPTDLHVMVEWGPNRNKMTTHAGGQTFDNEIREIFHPGKYFWRWVVVQKKDRQVVWASPSAKANIVGYFPPTIASPKDGEALFLNPQELVTFRWLPQRIFSHYILEIAKDKEFKKMIVSGAGRSRCQI